MYLTLILKQWNIYLICLQLHVEVQHITLMRAPPLQDLNGRVTYAVTHTRRTRMLLKTEAPPLSRSLSIGLGTKW